MIRLQHYPPALLMSYAFLLLFGAQGLLETPAFSPAWWTVASLLLALAVQVMFWPVRRLVVYLYLAVMFGLIVTLSALNEDFIFLGFLFSGFSSVLLTWRQTRLVIAAFSVTILTVLVAFFGWGEGLLPGLASVIGFFAFGYAYSMREQAEQAREETQRLLDDLRDAHARLEQYAVQAQELAAVEERNRIARELHDSVKQQAFAASGQLGAARALLQRDSDAAAGHLRTAEALLDEIRGELGQLIHQLRPVALQERGLAEALREWGAGWAQQSGIALEVRVQGESRLPMPTEQALLRITQEALSNVARHSQATQAEISLDYGPEQVRLEIHDNGHGFTPHPASAGQGLGLRTMRERAARLPGGQFDLHSAPDQGTRIQVRSSKEQA